jgi:DHA1 family tetracycline resistance protein-like MFS transporter
VVAAPVSGTLFGYFIGPLAPVHLPGIAFLVGAAMFVAGLAVAWRPRHAFPPAPTGLAKDPAE